jgi:hypothetical protein
MGTLNNMLILLLLFVFNLSSNTCYDITYTSASCVTVASDIPRDITNSHDCTSDCDDIISHSHGVSENASYIFPGFINLNTGNLPSKLPALIWEPPK